MIACSVLFPLVFTQGLIKLAATRTYTFLWGHGFPELPRIAKMFNSVPN